MARDNLLDQLKAEQDRAFEAKQRVYDKMQAAWKERESVKQRHDRAYNAKQTAYDMQDHAWKHYQSVRQSNGPRIDSLKSQQEAAYQNMVRSYEQSRRSWDSGDRASATTYSEDAKRYKAESQGYVSERRRLVNEIRFAKTQHELVKPAFQKAKGEFEAVKHEYDKVKSAHLKARDEFNACKTRHDKARAAFKSRLDIVKAANQKRRDDIWVSRQPDGTVNIYFGGVGKPDGPGHGHYAMDAYGTVTYRRNPFDPHGTQNFEKADLYMRSARRDHEPLGTNEHGGIFYRRNDTGGTELHITQYFSDGYHVSWDATTIGNKNIHWTNKNLRKGDPNRFTPPEDSLI